MFLDWDLFPLLLLLHFFQFQVNVNFHWLKKINKPKMKIHASQYLKKEETHHCHSQLVMLPTILSFLFLIQWLKNTEVLKVFWQAKAKLFLLTQVAWSRVTDDTDGTDGVADIRHSYPSMKTLNWKLIVRRGEKLSTCFYSNLWGQEASGRESTLIFRRDQQSRSWGWGFFRSPRLREATQTRDQFAGAYVSFFELLLDYPAFSGRKKKWLKSRHNRQDSPGFYTQTEPFFKGVNCTTQKMLPYRHAWKSIVRAHGVMNKHIKKESIRNILLITSSLAEVFIKASSCQGLSQNNQKKISVCYIFGEQKATSEVLHQQTKAGSNSGILANNYHQKTHVCKYLQKNPKHYFLNSRATAVELKSLKFHLSDRDHSSSKGRNCCMGLDNF